MKSALAILAMFAAGVAANAQTGGFKGPDNRQVVMAAEVADLPDDAEVRLTGYVVRNIGDETYEFRDDTGTIIVEIDDEDWKGLEVTPEQRVEITGEVDQERQKTELEVDTIRLAE
ncbi:MAG TPA: NirD/YgiW/YdeI family stress tolerance protein [Woeseiaceae bacterium]|jgi:uncharacterized protein (TIGR00156 family)|nr:NirD/YgiW/YdeI family stress tolerance protein [Woeseiaceae bacterium]